MIKFKNSIFFFANKWNFNLIFVFLLFILLFSNCAGYKSYSNKNPFKKYKIASISIPLFVNKSIIPNLSSLATQSIGDVLMSFTKLKVYFGANYKADAFLIGVVESKNKFNELYKPSSFKFIDGSLQDSIGKRRSFYIPTRTSYSYVVNFFLIKHPARSDLKFIDKDLPKEIISKHPKIIFSKSITISSGYNHPLKFDKSKNSGAINFTQAQGNFNDSLIKSTKSLAKQFEQMVLNELF